MRADTEIKSVKPNRGVDIAAKSRAGITPATRKKTTRRTSPSALLTEHTEAKELSVKFQYYNPQAIEVFVAGSFNDWDPRRTALTHDGNGGWVAALELMPGQYEYRFIVDGIWQEDSMAAKFCANPFGGLNSVIEVG